MLIEIDVKDWEKRRKVLVHDVLGNKINPALAKLCAVLAGRVEDPNFIGAVSEVLRIELPEIRDDIEWLVHNASVVLSPRNLFTCTPLNGLDADTQLWLPDAVDELWAARVNLRDCLCA